MKHTQIQVLLGGLIREHQQIGKIIATQLSFAKLRATPNTAF